MALPVVEESVVLEFLEGIASGGHTLSELTERVERENPQFAKAINVFAQSFNPERNPQDIAIGAIMTYGLLEAQLKTCAE